MLAGIEHTGQSHIRDMTRDFSCIGLAISFLFGLIGFLCSGLDVVFGIVMACSIFTSFITSCVCGFLFLWFSRKFIPSDKEKWAIPLAAAFQDVIRCIVLLQVSRVLFSMTGSVVIDGDVCILG